MTKTVMLIAGEASGDKHGAEIVRRLHASDSDLKFTGMGSTHMRTAGVELLLDSRNIAVVGLFEVLAHWNEIQAALKTLQNSIINNPPDLLLLIDYPEFNLKLAATAKSCGVKVLFYVSPQVWAWRSGRVKKIGRVIDMMGVIFPFEVSLYEKHNVPVRYVGHPLTGNVNPAASRGQARLDFGLNPHRMTVALLPGSRKSEIKRLLPLLAETAGYIEKAVPGVQFILPVASTLDPGEIRAALAQYTTNITLTDNRTYDAVSCSDAAIVASGTATLEVALLQTPMCIVYRVSPISYAIFKRLIKIQYVGLANIVAGEQVAKEFIQENAEPRAIAEETVKQLKDDDYRNKLIEKLGLVKDRLGKLDGIQGISNLALEMLN
ncbi:MAG TPA: lipid-A-disaccharide synthase [Gammaproteobacteria bacterium]